MGENKEPDETQLFLVRVWGGSTGKESGRIQGKVLHVLSGKGNNFSDGAALIDLLVGTIPPISNDDDPSGEKVSAL